MLVVGGTTSDDEIEIEWDNDDSHFEVEINDHDLGNYAASGRIVVYALAGDDKVELAGNITQSAWLYGGRGDDHLKGGKGDDVLLGGKGDDLLVGGSGRDLMIAGYGEDRVVGNSDDDILISGVTDFDSNDNALQAILLEWTSDNCYATRVDHLTGQSGGLNGTIYLTFDGPTATVHDDNAKDTLTGSAGNDWFFANLFLDNGDDATKKDKITDLHASEFASDLDFILS
jgi:Ca2+-binding RTX toxin-like protein